MYSRLSTIFSFKDLPEEFDFIKTGLEVVLEQLFYRNIQVLSSNDGISMSYYLELVSPNKLEFDLFGSGIKLILNSDFNNSISYIPISFKHSTEIKRYVKGLDLNLLSNSAEEFYKLLFSIVKISDDELVFHLLKSLIDDQNPEVVLVNHLNNNYQTNIQLPPNPDRIEAINEILVSLSMNSSIFLEQIIFNDFIQGPDALSNLEKLFSIKFGGKMISNFLGLFKPQINGTIELNAGVKFPRKYLIPMKEVDNVYVLESNESIESEITFANGELNFNSKGGIQFDQALEVNFKFPYEAAQISQTGLIISITDAKVDLSKKENIQEASLDGRPVDFIGVYFTEAIIGLPPKWFKQDGTTLGIFGRNLLIGTGGISGSIGLEAIGGSTDDELFFQLGRKSERAAGKGLSLGFRHFHMLWQQNSLIESLVEGSLYLPKFKQCILNTTTNEWETQVDDLKIDIEAIFEQDGDFEITAKPGDGLSLCVHGVFIVTVKSLSVGKDDDKVFIEIVGSIRFDNNAILKEFISEAIEIQKLRIYGDGSFEIEGGKIPLPKNIALKIGPTEISISAIHLGSFEKEYDGLLRQYKYLGFDGGVSVDPNSFDASGQGLKYNFTTDNDSNSIPLREKHQFLSIESLAINLQIPGDVEPEKATLIAKGFLALDDPDYTGKISFSLPKAKISGGAAMRFNKVYPAFIVDAFLELAAGIPLANTGLFIYGFRGLFGRNYSPDKEESQNWVDWYNAPTQGVDIGKFNTPGDDDASKSISVGAGMAIATQSDALSLQVFLLLALRNLILIEGKANILGERLTYVGGNAPFYALLIIDLEESIRLAIGVDYMLPNSGSDAGKILHITGTIDSQFYFKNSDAWYVHIGTKESPIQAKILDLFNAYSFLMISKKGIKAGAGVSFSFNKTYVKVVKVSASAYFDIYGKISFESPQIGGSIAVGGSIDVSLFGIGFFISLDTLLSVEVPEPFKIYGMVRLCVGVKVLFKRIEKCFQVEFAWERKGPKSIDPIYGLELIYPSLKETPIKGIHMLNENVYDIPYFGITEPTKSEIDKYYNDNDSDYEDIPVIPIDTFIDIEFSKFYRPNSGLEKIGGYSNPSSVHVEVIPPIKGDRQQRHDYSINQIKIEYYDGSGFVDYHPYDALYADPIGNYNPSDLNIGFWQKSDKGYNKVRLLAESPFSYIQNAQPSWYVPAQMGLSGATLFCEGNQRGRHCIDWTKSVKQQFSPNTLYNIESVGFRIKNSEGVIKVGEEQKGALCIKHGGTVELFFPHQVFDFTLKLHHKSHLPVTISYYKEVWNEVLFNGESLGSKKSYELIEEKSYSSAGLIEEVEYYIDESVAFEELHNEGIVKVVIETEDCHEMLEEIDVNIEQYYEKYYQEKDEKTKEQLLKLILQLENRRHVLGAKCCDKNNKNPHSSREELYQQMEFLKTEKQKAEKYIKNHCNLKDKKEDKYKGKLDVKSKPVTKVKDVKIEDLKNFKLDNTIKIPTGKEASFVSGSFIKWPMLNKACIDMHVKLREILLQIESINIELANMDEQGENISDCTTCIEKICYTTVEDHLYNVNIPPMAAIEEDFNLMQSAIENTISPIWRPDTYFRVKVELQDDYRNYNGDTGSQSKAFYFGFKTAKSIGHYPEDQIKESQSDTVGSPASSDFDAVKQTEKESYENLLKYYLDYDKSYPKPDGDLQYAKPLYYEDNNPAINGIEGKPRLLLFYVKDYVHHFFTDQWSSGDTYEMVIDILDPTEVSPEYINSLGNSPSINNLNAMQANISSTVSEVPASEYFDVDTYLPEVSKINSSLLDDRNCVGSFSPIEPKVRFLTISIEDLKPLKLYTAQIKNRRYANSGYEDKLVHKYNFQTSRYASFKEHIDSYILKKDDDGNIIRKGLFSLEKSLSSNQISELWTTISSGQSSDDDLYPDNYDKIIHGLLDIKSFDPSVFTEVNVIKSNNNVVGLWVRSPEPFNDPRMPFDLLNETVTINSPSSNESDFKAIYSRDGSEIFIMKINGTIISDPDLSISIEFKLWSGKEYEVIDTQEIEVFNSTIN